MNKVCSSIQENSLQVLVVNDRIQVFKQKLNLKTYICHHELDSFPILKDSLDNMKGNVNKCDFFIGYIIKCINIWNICITHSINILQMANKIHYKITHG